MKDDNGKRITLVHDRFQVCCAICQLVSGHQRKQDAIESAKRHSCEEVEVWDAMARDKDNDVVWRKYNYIACDGGKRIDKSPAFESCAAAQDWIMARHGQVRLGDRFSVEIHPTRLLEIGEPA